jgi:DNA-binding PadR family transcriptional regulator
VSIKIAILQLLDEGPSHGYALKQAFEKRTGGVWPLNIGQVYTTIDRLIRDGLVREISSAEVPIRALPSATADSVQRVVALTEAGALEMKQWLREVLDVAPTRDEQVIKVLVACGRSTEHGLQIIDQQRSALLASLQAARKQQRERTSLPEQFADDVFASRLEADLRWLDRCEARLRTERITKPTRGGNR